MALWWWVPLANVKGWLSHGGYVALGALVLAGNVGFPVPENTVLWTAGYLAWKGKLWGPAVLTVGIVAAILGDNLGYWLGQRYGHPLLDRYGTRLGLSVARRDRLQTFVTMYGGWAVFCARFVLGLRVLAGPLAGSVGLPFKVFFLGNAAGALCYVPAEVGIGYALAYGVGHLSAHHAHQVQLALGITLVVSVTAFVMLHLTRRPPRNPASG
jgi:membrane protein DedA with SNARE-associated domain